MEAVEQRPPAQLPSIGFLDIEKIKREEAEYQRKNTATTMVSPSFPYSCPPPPYSQPSATASSPTGARSGLISPPESRRTSGDDAPLPPLPPAPARQSLPSIHEALASGSDPLPRYHLPPTPTTAPPVSTPTYSQPPPATSSTDPIRNSYTTEPPRSEPPYSQPTPRSPYMNQSSQSFQAAPPLSQPDSTRPSYYAPSEPKLPTLHPINTGPLTTGQSPVSQIRPSLSYQQPQSTYEPAPQSAPATAPYPYSQYPSPYPYPPPPTSSSGPIYPPSGVLSAPPRYGGGWRSEADQRSEERRGSGPTAVRAYGEAVKRHLDIFDLEASLNEIAESSGTLLEFSKHFGVKAHQTQRSGPLPGSIPTLENIEDLLQKSQKIQDALTRIKEVVITQNVAFAEQQKGPNQQMVNGYGPEPNGYQPPDETKAGGFAGPDPKKRRGRAAPPGRCHSCNRAETPEWRRGPDGARTLCNACGLHYAKLTRKVGQKSAIGSSNLRPKGPGSPGTA